MLMVAKSGWPVTGHTLVNSGNSNSISYSRPGRGFSNASRIERGFSICASVRTVDLPAPAGLFPRKREVGGVGFGLGRLGIVLSDEVAAEPRRQRPRELEGQTIVLAHERLLPAGIDEFQLEIVDRRAAGALGGDLDDVIGGRLGRGGRLQVLRDPQRVQVIEQITNGILIRVPARRRLEHPW